MEIASRLSKLNENDLDDYRLKLRNLLHLRPNLIKVVKELEEKDMPITINVEEDYLYLKGKAEGEAKGEAKGKAEGMSQAKRTYVVNSYKNLHLTLRQIASIIGDSEENVATILKEEGLI